MKTRTYVYGVDVVNGNDAWALFVACAAGDAGRVRKLLSKDSGLANAQHWYQFPIHMAVRSGNAEIVKLLLDGGADPGQSRFTYNSWDKLLQLARDRDYKTVESLLVRTMKRRFRYSADFQDLRSAMIARKPRRTTAIVRQNPKLVKASDELGNNPIHWSVMTRQLGLIKQFVDLGTPIDAPRADGQSPLLLAISQCSDYWYRGTRGHNHPSIRNAWVMVGDLLANGARYTISVAAAVGDRERVEELLRKNADSARQLNSARVSPLSYAAREGYTHIVELLLSHGANPNQPEDLAPKGRALFEACAGNHLKTAELLLKHGADPNSGVDSCGCCLTIGKHHHGADAKPMQKMLRHYGAYSPPYEMTFSEMKQAMVDGHEVIYDEEFLGNVIDRRSGELLDLLLKADPAVTDRMQVYAGISYPKSPALIRKLLANGLDPNRPDWMGKTFLHACAESGDIAGARLFLDAGADINARETEFSATPLAAAVRGELHGSEEDREEQAALRHRMVDFLLELGAATNLPGDPPWATPLAWAKKRRLDTIEKTLLNHGATG